MPVFDLAERTIAKMFKVPTGMLLRLVVRSTYVGIPLKFYQLVTYECVLCVKI